MQGFNWEKIRDNKIGSTLFTSLSDDSITLDIDALEAAFGAQEDRAKSAQIKNAEKIARVSSYLDPGRAQNIGIMLARVKMCNEEICGRLIECDSNDAAEFLTVDTLKILAACLPNEEEATGIEGFLSAHGENILDSLGKAEQFQRAMIHIAAVKDRVGLLLFQREFTHSGKLKLKISALDVIEAALTELGTSQSFVRMLELTLAVGNYMNGGTMRGGANGFALSALNKLADVRSTTNKNATLLDFLAKLVKEKHPQIGRFGDELHSVSLAAKEEFSGIATELSELRRSVTTAQAQLREVKNVPDSEKIVAMMEPLVTQAAAELIVLVDRVGQLEKQKAEVMVLFGEDTKSGDIQEMFQEVAKFCDAFAAASASTISFEAKPTDALVVPVASETPVDAAIADVQNGNFRRRATSISRMSMSSND
eukprot:SAG31_NODE_310_length_17887_cov_4.623060_6_plen_424_part_00